MWREQDRFPLDTAGGMFSISDDQPSGASTRPFGLRFVSYSPGRPRFIRPEVRLCPERQIGVVEGSLPGGLMPLAATMTSFESDGKDVLKVDWAKDDK